jgi:hypothetical protein
LTPTSLPTTYEIAPKNSDGALGWTRFMRIVSSVEVYDDYVMCKKHWTWFWGFSSAHRCHAALPCIAYEAPPYAQDDNLFMYDTTCFDSIY